MTEIKSPPQKIGVVTRFAPSPTGLLHLGHACAALFAETQARAANGRFLLRIEDIDRGRCRAEFENAIYGDLAWLGLTWETPVRRQSDCMADYQAALERLNRLGVLYPCFCTRADIKAEIEAAQGAPHLAQNADQFRGGQFGPIYGPDGPLYPGTCRALTMEERESRVAAGMAFALRLDMKHALNLAHDIAGELTWRDLDEGEIKATPEIFGDVVLARKDTPTSYHLAVTVDDHIQGVTLVTRGEDLFPATHIHRLLQALLGLDVPVWRHHGLLVNADGKRLAKRDQAETLQSLRQSGHSPAQVRRMAGFT
ncbi:MAG: tRNA glutamyl-Q(34) synthetase GluQRS [Rhodospirillales bacterium]|nr:tRNA glutamyl-Q(34) synthetase GluQRS [Rhodospirillales bacterium]